ncbi:hypothetical protein C8R42DRAFT_665798 [Lentinula raphanica]|nr:hypothetical protein C8R42DRAFT_665798 [Lentinula raphanica]
MYHPSSRDFSSSPFNSPPSSPNLFPDSSPASSPGIDPLALNTDDCDSSFKLPLPAAHSPPLHPFSGSAKQVKKFHMHEQKVKRSLSPSLPDSPTNTSLSSKKKLRYTDKDEYEEDRSYGEFLEPKYGSQSDFDPDIFSSRSNTRRRRDPQEEFHEVVGKALEDCCLHIGFERQGLTYIPEAAISDLAKIVVLDPHSEREFVNLDTYARANNDVRCSPTSPMSHHRQRSQLQQRLEMGRTPSTRVISGVPREQMTLLLADNRLSRLPPQFFHLNRLTVLSLRTVEQLDVSSPQISLLTSLKELNVASNKLKYLPSEMMDMCLSKLSVQPNPFIPLPPAEATLQRAISRSRSRTQSKSGLSTTPPIKVISPVKTIDQGVPSLVELCLRMSTTVTTNNAPTRSFSSNSPLFSTHSPLKTTPDADLASQREVDLVYDLPPNITLPPLIKSRFHYAKPGIINNYSTDGLPVSDSDDITGVGFCPSPHHKQEGEELNRTLFYQHVEERFTWENVIAGVGSLGEIPVRWRGCRRGCLDFLDQEKPKNTSSFPSSSGVDSSTPTTGSDFASITSAHNGVPNTDIDLEEIVKPMNLTQTCFTEEDFGDE